jgi:hypothetical protein
VTSSLLYWCLRRPEEVVYAQTRARAREILGSPVKHERAKAMHKRANISTYMLLEYSLLMVVDLKWVSTLTDQ